MVKATGQISLPLYITLNSFRDVWNTHKIMAILFFSREHISREESKIEEYLQRKG
jgi:hypothetical protein